MLLYNIVQAMSLQEEFYQVMTRLKANSRAAAVIKAPCDMIVSDNPNRINNNNNSRSKAASSPTTQYETVITKYDMGGSASSDNIVYQCGTHNFETKNLKEFNEHVARTHDHNDTGSKAASASVPSINKIKTINDFIIANGRI
jgi:hypothetical protein